MNRVKGYAHAVSIEEQKKLLAMKRTTRSQLHEGDRLWEGRLWDICQLMNKNLIRGYQGRTSWHNTTKSLHSTLLVNEAVGQRRYQCLPMEICLALRFIKMESAQGGNILGDEAEVSRGHISWDKTNRGVDIDSNSSDEETRDPWKYYPVKG